MFTKQEVLEQFKAGQLIVDYINSCEAHARNANSCRGTMEWLNREAELAEEVLEELSQFGCFYLTPDGEVEIERIYEDYQ